jgi:tRNA threonylcarbamoyladenosine biosynthesis protein TsaE
MGSEFQVSSFKLHITSHSFEETQELGENIGTLISDPTLLALTGDTSPSFTLINEYPGRMRLFHVDLYRLENYTDLEETGLYDILEGDGVVAVEWAEKLPEDLLSTHIAIGFNIIDDKTREINLIAYGHDAVGLIKALKHKKNRAISLEG